MASNLALLEEHLSCPVCCEIFKNPVVLLCSHSFCEKCLQLCWENTKDYFCPVCRKTCSPEEPQINVPFKNLCESFERDSGKTHHEVMCQQHGEKLKLFCIDDKKPICVVCHTSKKHKGHECYPVEEAASELKDKIKTMVLSLDNKLKVMRSAKVDHQTWKKHINSQALCGEQQFRTAFQELHKFIEEEEVARVAALRKEEEQKCAAMDELIESIDNSILVISATIEMINENIETEEVVFLQNYQALCDSEQGIPEHPTNVELDLGLFMDIANHVGSLKYKVCKKMIENIDYTSVTIDPNTACQKLLLMDDLTSMMYCEESQNLPNNPERFMIGAIGSEGYSNGCHFWDVAVGESDHWTLGVVKESINRKKMIKMDPESGIWSIRYVSGKYRVGVKSRKKINVVDSPRVIRILLDCDEGQVKFVNHTNNTELHTFNCEFTEKIFPYFNTSSLICPLRFYKQHIVLNR